MKKKSNNKIEVLEQVYYIITKLYINKKYRIKAHEIVGWYSDDC